MPYAIDLFCGAGGMSEGLIQAGFHILFSNDISSDVQKTYVNRHSQLGFIDGYNTVYHCGDIRELTGEYIMESIRSLEVFNNGNLPFPENIDAVFGGPPCQGFSRAGKRSQDDPRNLLFREYLRVINQVRPRYVVMENVEGFNDTAFLGFEGLTGIRYSDGALAPDILISEFEHIGYNVLDPQMLDAYDYGVPQKRRRVIFIAYLQGENIPNYPKPIICNEDKELTVLDAIGDLISDRKIRETVNPILTQYQIESRNGRTPNLCGDTIAHTSAFLNNEHSRHQRVVLERFSLFLEGEDGGDVKMRILEKGIDLKRKKHLLSECAKKTNLPIKKILQQFESGNVDNNLFEVLLTKKNIRTRLCRNKPSLTVVTLPDDYISPFEDRILSVREMARLQSFDDSFEFLSKRTTGGDRRKSDVPQYTQVGNAVPPLMAKAISLEIRKALEGIE